MAEKNAAEKKAKSDTHGRVKAVLGGKSKSKKKKLRGMHVRHAASGGYIAKHEQEPEPSPTGAPQESPEHIIPDMEALKSHMQEHMGQDEGEGGEEPQPGANPAG